MIGSTHGAATKEAKLPKIATLVLMLVFTAALSGCSRSPFDSDVAGSVTLDGAAIGPGVIIFSPVDGGRNASRGNLAAGGDYHLVTKHARGLDPGSYQVAVQVYDQSNAPPPGQRQMKRPESLVPNKYLDVKTSGLEYTVEPGSNTIDIALTSD